jgi:hypothetical protein
MFEKAKTSKIVSTVRGWFASDDAEGRGDKTTSGIFTYETPKPKAALHEAWTAAQAQASVNPVTGRQHFFEKNPRNPWGRVP